MIKSALISCMLTFLIIFCAVANTYAVDVDLEKGFLKGKPFKTKIDYIISLYGEPSIKGLYYDYYDKYGFRVMINTDTNFIAEYSFYLLDWDPFKTTKVPKMNKGYNGTFSYGIKAGVLFKDVLNNLKNSKKKFMAFKGDWCFNYSSNCKDPGYLIIFEIDTPWYGEIQFDESGKAFAISLNSQKSSAGNTESPSPYLQRINTESVKEMLIIDHS